MPGPREEERRKLQFDPASTQDPGRREQEVLSSKRVEKPGRNVPDGNTRARRPRSGRSGSDSNASRRTRGHSGQPG
jgi:hypothetical protein